jgi:polar amino acid transport system substrate-binding protein
MKNQFFRILFVCIILIISSMQVAMAETMKVRADKWCPYNCDPKIPTKGILVEMMQIIFAKDGNTLDYDIMTWAEAMAQVRTGRFDAAIGIGESDSVGMIHTSIPQMISITCAFGLNNSKISIHKATDLKKLKSIGVIKDYSYGEQTDAVLKNPDMEKKLKAIGTDDALAANIRLLLDGKIEALVEDINVLSYQLSLRKITKIKNLGCTEDKNSGYIGFTKTNPKSKMWVEMLSKGQAELEKSGKLSEIYGRYGIKR